VQQSQAAAVAVEVPARDREEMNNEVTVASPVQSRSFSIGVQDPVALPSPAMRSSPSTAASAASTRAATASAAGGMLLLPLLKMPVMEGAALAQVQVQGSEERESDIDGQSSDASSSDGVESSPGGALAKVLTEENMDPVEATVANPDVGQLDMQLEKVVSSSEDVPLGAISFAAASVERPASREILLSPTSSATASAETPTSREVKFSDSAGSSPRARPKRGGTDAVVADAYRLGGTEAVETALYQRGGTEALRGFYDEIRPTDASMTNSDFGLSDSQLEHVLSHHGDVPLSPTSSATATAETPTSREVKFSDSAGSSPRARPKHGGTDAIVADAYRRGGTEAVETALYQRGGTEALRGFHDEFRPTDASVTNSDFGLSDSQLEQVLSRHGDIPLSPSSSASSSAASSPTARPQRGGTSALEADAYRRGGTEAVEAALYQRGGTEALNAWRPHSAQPFSGTSSATASVETPGSRRVKFSDSTDPSPAARTLRGSSAIEADAYRRGGTEAVEAAFHQLGVDAFEADAYRRGGTEAVETALYQRGGTEALEARRPVGGGTDAFVADAYRRGGTEAVETALYQRGGTEALEARRPLGGGTDAFVTDAYRRGGTEAVETALYQRGGTEALDARRPHDHMTHRTEASVATSDFGLSDLQLEQVLARHGENPHSETPAAPIGEETLASTELPAMDMLDSLLSDIQENTHGGDLGANQRGVAEVQFTTDLASESSASSSSSSSSGDDSLLLP